MEIVIAFVVGSVLFGITGLVVGAMIGGNSTAVEDTSGLKAMAREIAKKLKDGETFYASIHVGKYSDDDDDDDDGDDLFPEPSMPNAFQRIPSEN